jgi:hypothetical protein
MGTARENESEQDRECEQGFYHSMRLHNSVTTWQPKKLTCNLDEKPTGPQGDTLQNATAGV